MMRLRRERNRAEGTGSTMPLSVVVVVYRMPRQARNTLLSLATSYQQGVTREDYEVIVVENPSDRMLGPEGLDGLAGTFRYAASAEPAVSPAAAVNRGIAMARGRMVSVMVDGARMVTPGVVRGILDAASLAGDSVVSVPGYHLGDALQQESTRSGYTEDVEIALLRELDWPAKPYSLFRRSVPSATSSNGFLMAFAESNCVAVPRDLLARLGGFDERFQSIGGGFVNLDFYRRAVLSKGIRLVVLPGEGSFHQVHGGATTEDPDGERESRIEAMREEYRRIRGHDYTPPEVRPYLLGSIPPEASWVALRATETYAKAHP